MNFKRTLGILALTMALELGLPLLEGRVAEARPYTPWVVVHAPKDPFVSTCVQKVIPQDALDRKGRHFDYKNGTIYWSGRCGVRR